MTDAAAEERLEPNAGHLLDPVDDGVHRAAWNVPLLIIGWLVRLVMLVPVIATFITGVALIIFGAMETWRFVANLYAGGHPMERNEALVLAIEIIDLFLLATVVQVVSLGLFQLYFVQNLRLPKWLRIEDLDDLKSKLVGVTVTVLAVYFLGQALATPNDIDTLYLGGGISVIIAALTYFLTKIGK